MKIFGLVITTVKNFKEEQAVEIRANAQFLKSEMELRLEQKSAEVDQLRARVVKAINDFQKATNEMEKGYKRVKDAHRSMKGRMELMRVVCQKLDEGEGGTLSTDEVKLLRMMAQQFQYLHGGVEDGWD